MFQCIVFVQSDVLVRFFFSFFEGLVKTSNLGLNTQVDPGPSLSPLMEFHLHFFFAESLKLSSPMWCD